MNTYQAVNTKDETCCGFAPAIYNVGADGFLSDTHMNWQRADGSSKAGDLDADRAACAVELKRLADSGHSVGAA